MQCILAQELPPIFPYSSYPLFLVFKDLIFFMNLPPSDHIFQSYVAVFLTYAFFLNRKPLPIASYISYPYLSILFLHHFIS